MKRIISIITAIAMSLFTPAFLPSCATPSPGTIKTPEQVALERAAKIRGAAGAAAFTAILATPPEDRPRLAKDLVSAANAIADLSAETATASRIAELVAAYIGDAKPEYIALASLLADQLAVWTGGLGSVAIPDAVKWIAQGVKTTASHFTAPAK